jgi:hypothetical protein
MIYAQIKNNLITNTIQIDDITLLPLFTVTCDACIQIDNITPQPGIGWSYDGSNFTNQITLPTMDSSYDIPSGTETTFAPFTLCSDSGGYMVSVNGSVLSIGCQNYDYVSLRYVLYMLLVQQVGTIGLFIQTSIGLMQNNQFVVTQADATIIYAALCTLV